MDVALTLNQIVGVNVKRLRQRGIRVGGTMQRGTATLLAKVMSAYLGEKYTRYVVADIEGRRDRNVRWHELVALCEIFECPLWELILPPEGVGVATPRPLRGPTTKVWGIAGRPDITFSIDEFIGRDDLAALLFSLNADELADGALANFRDKMKEERDKQTREYWDEATAVVRKMEERLKEFAEALKGKFSEWEGELDGTYEETPKERPLAGPVS